MSSRSVVITGGCGFLGSHLAENFSKAGYQVFAVDNFATGFRLNKSFLETLPGVKVIEADVSQKETWESLKKLVSSVEFVFHFASPASPPHYQKMALETMAVNSWGTQWALETADHWKARVVFASTSEIYGDPLVHPQKETYWGNVNTVGIRSCYDESKRYGETLIHTWNWKKGTKHGFVRIFNTYGPRMNPTDGRVIINFLEQAIQKTPLTMYGDGKQTRSFCYVDDLIAGIIAYAKSGLVQPVNIGNEKEFTLLELVDVLKEIFHDQKLEVNFFPLPADDPQQRRPDITQARNLLKWEPKIQLREGLQKMRVWLESLRQEG